MKSTMQGSSRIRQGACLGAAILVLFLGSLFLRSGRVLSANSSAAVSAPDFSDEQKLTASDGQAGDQFGFVALAMSGATLVVGSLNDDIGANLNQGSAYVFEP